MNEAREAAIAEVDCFLSVPDIYREICYPCLGVSCLKMVMDERIGYPVEYYKIAEMVKFWHETCGKDKLFFKMMFIMSWEG